MQSSSLYKEVTITTDETDDMLISKCLGKDRLSQHLLYKRYARKMLAVCNRYSKSMEDAEETLSEGFIRVFEKLDTYKGIGSFEGWMRRIMVNLAIEKFRKKNLVFVELNTNYLTHGTDLYRDTISGRIDAKELLSLIQRLPPTYQMVFNLFAFEGLKHKEIAERLGISEGTSKSNLSDARTWLKKEMERIGYN